MTAIIRHTDVLGFVVGGFPPKAPFIGWRTYTVSAVYTDPELVEFPVFKMVKSGGPTTDTISQVQARTGPYFVDRNWPHLADMRGSFPGLAWYLMHPTTMALVAGPLLPIGSNAIAALPQGTRDITPTTQHYVQWYDMDDSAIVGPYIAVLVAKEPTDALPLWVNGHPVEIVERLLQEKGEAYNAASATSVIASLGAELRHPMPVTTADDTVQDVIDELSAVYGFSVRRSLTGGETEFFYWREKLNGLPATTLTMADVAIGGGPTFDLSESSILNRVRFTGQFITIAPTNGTFETRIVGFKNRRPVRQRIFVPSTDTVASRLMVQSADVTFSYSTDGLTPDADTFGEADLSIDLGGAPSVAIASGGAHPLNFEQWSEGVAHLLFDGHARGRQMATFPAIRGRIAASDGLLGDTLTLNLDHLPNAQLGRFPTSQRGDERPFRIIGRTEEPTGPLLKLADEGTGVQYGTVPEITVGPDTATPDVYLVTVTNADLLTADGVRVEFQARVFGPTETVDLTNPGFRITTDDATSWTEADQVLRFGTFPQNHRVGFRARAFYVGGAASDWSAWAGLGTTGGTTLGNLQIINIGSDRATLTWDYLESPPNGLVKVEYRVTGAPSYTIFASLAAGTETVLLHPITAATQYDVRVVLTNPVEYGDVLTGSFWTLGGVIQNLQQTSSQPTESKFTWSNSHATARVIVELRRTGAPVYFTFADLNPTSDRIRVTGLTPGAAYDIRIRLQDPITGADLGDGNTAPGLVLSWTAPSGLATLDPPTNAAVFGNYNPFTGVEDGGLFGLRVNASFVSNPPHDIIFEVAEETAAGSGLPGTYIAQGPIAAVVGGPTWFVGRAANNGRLQYLRAFARVGNATTWNDSSKTPALSVNPWSVVPLPPLGGGANDSEVISSESAIAEDAHATGSVSFPDGSELYRITSPDLTQFRIRLYQTESVRDSDLSRAVTDLNWPADLLLDVSVTSVQSFSIYLAPRIQILLATLGDNVVYWTLTNYDPPTQVIRAQIFYAALQSTGGTNPVGGTPPGGGSGVPVT